MKRLLTALAVIAVCAFAALAPALSFAQEAASTSLSTLGGKPDLIEVIDLKGEIGDGTAEAVKAQVEKINDQPKIKAVLLDVDTPGGTVSASQAIYAELAKIKVPVVGYCARLCASGGEYSLMSPSVKFIGVSADAVSGSIGVILHLTRYYRLLDWAKIDVETYKSGELKDDGNPTRGPSAEERKRLQAEVDKFAQKFYSIVLKARPKADMAAIKPAGVFFGEEAVTVGLADAVMTRDEAVAKAKVLSGSKLAFTREELSKMTKAAHESTAYEAPARAPRAELDVTSDLHTLVQMLQEIRSGEVVRLEYRMPMVY
jgi:signal peptide peptidase SppA